MTRPHAIGPRGVVVARVVSGGQTGADRGALNAARALGLSHGGWCPRGRRAEDGRIPDCYQLRETSSARYDVRTEQNVLDSDGTLIFFRHRPGAGTALTHRLVRRHGKPHRLVDLAAAYDIDEIRNWLTCHAIQILNVAGPRESSCAGIEAEVETVLRRILGAGVPSLDGRNAPPRH